MSASGGSGFLGLSIFGRSNKGAGHVVEVVLGGRSTLYHVYKRPFVDYFLRKASNRTMCSISNDVMSFMVIGIYVVHTRYIHGFDARVR